MVSFHRNTQFFANNCTEKSGALNLFMVFAGTKWRSFCGGHDVIGPTAKGERAVTSYADVSCGSN